MLPNSKMTAGHCVQDSKMFRTLRANTQLQMHSAAHLLNWRLHIHEQLLKPADVATTMHIMIGENRKAREAASNLASSLHACACVPDFPYLKSEVVSCLILFCLLQELCVLIIIDPYHLLIRRHALLCGVYPPLAKVESKVRARHITHIEHAGS